MRTETTIFKMLFSFSGPEYVQRKHEVGAAPDMLLANGDNELLYPHIYFAEVDLGKDRDRRAPRWQTAGASRYQQGLY